MTGWTTVIGWQALNTSNAYLLASMIQGTVVLTQSTYSPKPWEAVLITWAVILFAVGVNIISSRALARFEGIILILHLFGFFGILIPLVFYGPHGDASLFTTLNNGGEWSTTGFSFVVGLPTFVFCLFGELSR